MYDVHDSTRILFMYGLINLKPGEKLSQIEFFSSHSSHSLSNNKSYSDVITRDILCVCVCVCV